MRSFWSEPFLWIHLAGLAALPLCLALCWLGLASGESLLPGWLEICLVAIAGITPILWMQLARPFNIFSILVVALKPEQLTTQQRQILSLFKRPLNKVLALLAPILFSGFCGKFTVQFPSRHRLLSFHPNGEWLGCC